MNRRGFLKMLGLAAPAAVVAPKYFFAPLGGWKSDVITNPSDFYDVAGQTLFPVYGPDGGIADMVFWMVRANTGLVVGIDRAKYPERLHV
jgi:hypothetical protein